MKYTVKWLPAPYEAWGVLCYDEKTGKGIITAYYCNEDDSKEQAIAHCERLKNENAV